MKATILPKDEYKSSRIFYYLEVACEYLISVITSGVYLAKLTTTIGISDATTAVLSTVGSLAGAFQILSIFLSHRQTQKPWIVPFRLVEQILRAGMFLLPFLSVGAGAMSAIFFIMTLVYQLLFNASTPTKTVWFMNLVDKDKQGNFVAISKIVSLAIGMASTLVFGIMLDKFEARGNINGAFLLIAIVLLITSLIHATLLILSKEKPQENTEQANPLSNVKAIFKNKLFVRFLIINVIWSITANLSMPFMNTYKINELGFNMTVNSILEVVFSIINIIFFFVFGKLSAKVKSLTLLKVGYALYAVYFIVIAFVTPKTGLPLFVAGETIYLVGLSAVTVGGTIVYRMVKEDEFTASIAFMAIGAGIFGFVSTLATTPLFEYIKNTLGGQIFGTTVYAQQVLSMISAVLTVVIVILISRLINEPTESDSETQGEPECQDK